MSFSYLALYTGDYLRDTRHLTPLKHGVYLLLLMHCWDSRGPAPLDEQECAGIANCRSSDEVDALRYVLERYFVRMDDGWYNKRIQKEIERSCAISNARSNAGKLGYQAKAKQLPSNWQASVSNTTTTTIPPPPPGVDVVVSQRGTPHAPRDKSRDAGDTATIDAVISIPIVGGGEYPVSQQFASELEALYPAVDMPQTLREIRAWNIANPKHRKTASGIKRHINQWFAKDQNRG
jgi:uncharacterized protein YdaU (DUF1376 family)